AGFGVLGVRKITLLYFPSLRFGHLLSRLKDGAKLGCRGAAIGPPNSDACTRLM
ncbi:hypothetical protein HMPREF0454_00404, partial [Hafnia alvei ATCC 51873]